MELTAHLLVLGFATIIVLCVVVFLVIDMFGRVDYIKSKAPFLEEVLKKRAALAALLLVTLFLLVGDGYELLTKEIPEVPNPPVLRLVPPAPPAITIAELAQPSKAQCWVKNYGAPAVPAPPSWGIATLFCNTTITPPYSVELNYDQAVIVGPFTFPVGSEFVKSMESNQGTKTVSMFDLHTIIPNEPFSIMARSSNENDKSPLVKTGTIRAKGRVFEFHP
jgi:hypothetical protein